MLSTRGVFDTDLEVLHNRVSHDLMRKGRDVMEHGNHTAIGRNEDERARRGKKTERIGAGRGRGKGGERVYWRVKGGEMEAGVRFQDTTTHFQTRSIIG